MKDVEFVESPQADGHLKEDAPDLVLAEAAVVLLVLADLLKEVSVVREFHDQTTSLASLYHSDCVLFSMNASLYAIM